MTVRKTAAVAVAALVAGGAGLLGATLLSDTGDAANEDQTIFCSEFVPNMEASSTYKKWATANSGEKTKWLTFRTGICADQNPAVPVVATAFGKALVAAGKMALTIDVPPTTTTGTTTTTTTTDTTTTATEPPLGTASLWVDASGGSCTRSTPQPYANNGTECSSMNVAYQDSETQCGDVIGVASSFGSAQLIAERTSLSACGSWVVFRGLNMPTIDKVCVGNCGGNGNGGAATNGPSHIEVRDLRTRGIDLSSDADGVLIDGVDGGAFVIEGAENVTIQNSDWGPCPSPSLPGPYCSANQSITQIRLYADSAGSRNIVIRNNDIHDFTRTGSDHWECIFQAGGTNVTIDGNRFWNCHTNAIAFGSEGNAANTAGAWYIQNNWVADGGLAFKVDDLPYAANPFVFRFNSFGPGEGIYNTDCCQTFNAGSAFAYGNIIGSTTNDCIGNVTYAFNFWVGGSGCGTNKVFGALPYVNTAESGSMNYHLAGASAADGFVTQSGGHFDLGHDFDGDSRAAPRDAGADER